MLKETKKNITYKLLQLFKKIHCIPTLQIQFRFKQMHVIEDVLICVHTKCTCKVLHIRLTDNTK